MSKVFISYRRDDSRYQARMIYDAFRKSLPAENVFMDVDSIPPGANFRKILNGWVSECEILLALIGPGWIEALDPKTGARRLDNASDFVRIEIGAALARDIPVVPVLLDGAPMPDAGRLPDELIELPDRQAEFVEYRTFDHDVARLIGKLRIGASPTSASVAEDRSAVPAVAPRVISVSGNVFSNPTVTVNQAALRKPLIRTNEYRVMVGPKDREEERWLKPGESIRDADFAPEMVLVPPGKFWMGSKEGEGEDNERPRHEVTIVYPLLVGKYPVTFEEWDAAGAAGGVTHKPGDEGWGRGKRPVINVSWDDAKAYIKWLSDATGKTYRLLSEAEWEYCCRAGTETNYAFGDAITKQQAQFSEGEWGSAKQTIEVGSFPANAFGLHDMHGNVWEWCEDLWHENYKGAPVDGSAWTAGGDTSRRVLRGSSWAFCAQTLRSSIRSGLDPGHRTNNYGFVLARTLSL